MGEPLSEALSSNYLSRVREVAESNLDNPEKRWLAQAAYVLCDEIRRLYTELEQANRERDELTAAVLEWWDNANDGQVLPDFVLITLRLKGEIVP